MLRFGVRVTVRFRSVICNLCVQDFEIALRILQTAQTDKSRARLIPALIWFSSETHLAENVANVSHMTGKRYVILAAFYSVLQSK